MKGDSYAVPADKLKGIQKSEGMSREGSKPDYIDIDGDGDKKESMKSASDGMSRQKYGGNKGDLRRSAKKDY